MCALSFTQNSIPIGRRLCRWLSVATCACWLLSAAGCGLRTVPPIRYIPLLGAEKKITTTSVLARALKDQDMSVRAQAVQLLGVLSQSDEKKVKKEVSQSLGTASRDRDPGIRLLAIVKLGEMEEEYSNKFLFAALKDSNPFVREKVLKVLEDREGQKAILGPAQVAAPPAP